MRYFGDTKRSNLPIPGDNFVRDKYDPVQEEHREKYGLLPRDQKPDYLSDDEWDQIKILPGEMWDPFPEWDGECRNECCRGDINRDLQY